MEQTSGYYSTFVVKIWCDGQTSRGHIRHIGTGEQMHFLSLADMDHFIGRHLVLPPADRVIDRGVPFRPARPNIERGDVCRHE